MSTASPCSLTGMTSSGNSFGGRAALVGIRIAGLYWPYGNDMPAEPANCMVDQIEGGTLFIQSSQSAVKVLEAYTRRQIVDISGANVPGFLQAS